MKIYGRHEQMNFLLDSLGAANQERGTVVFISGEAGVGKTFLLAKNHLASPSSKGASLVSIDQAFQLVEEAFHEIHYWVYDSLARLGLH